MTKKMEDAAKVILGILDETGRFTDRQIDYTKGTMALEAWEMIGDEEISQVPGPVFEFVVARAASANAMRNQLEGELEVFDGNA